VSVEASQGSDSVKIGDALSRYYRENGLPPDGGASLTTFTIHMGPFNFRAPNPPARQRAVFFHDVNHVVTGYNNVFSDGEMAIAGYEIGTGCGPYWIAWVINIGVFAVALFVCPRKLFRAFVRGRRAKSIYGCPGDRAALSAMTIRALRESMGVDANLGGISMVEGSSFVAWSLVALAWAALPIVAVVGIWKALS
jgi:hypothetical protein